MTKIPPATMLEASGLAEIPSTPRLQRNALMPIRIATITNVSTATR
jgi:hypothetical protein